ncbi:hypothetical protein GCM10023185_24260 [Hymenobacter saemangeumensis]|uniref:NlpC/P60 domain-containing protein n=1 Tax=Hymenobacter saemangeumensis TaxID=1084522 RepID=A0ABP8IGM0_9BACT
MRFIWLIFVGLLLAMLGILPRLERGPGGETSRPSLPDSLPVAVANGRAARAPVTAYVTSARPRAALLGRMVRRDSLVHYALQQLGTNYCYAGTTPASGFDCSGFVQYVFAHFGVSMPHSTALLIDVGTPVPREQALPGDIVVFTGTAPTATTPGHAGIIISAGPQGPLRFVHSSSARRESGVKISQVEGSDYERRFMQVRRVLGTGSALRPTKEPAPRPAAPAVTAPAPAPPVVVPAVPVPTPVAAPAGAVKKAAVKKKTVKRKPARKAAPRKAVRKPTARPRKAASKARPAATTSKKRTTR